LTRPLLGHEASIEQDLQVLDRQFAEPSFNPLAELPQIGAASFRRSSQCGQRGAKFVRLVRI
jgi:hypothetical protein